MSRVTSPKVLFDSLAGTWTLSRDLESANVNEPNGKCLGTATFTSRQSSPVLDANGKLQVAEAEMLYHEQGEFQLPSMIKVPFSKKYVWKLSKSEDSKDGKISVWFTKPGSEATDYLFHDIHISVTEGTNEPSLIQGSGGHLCVDDFYSTAYEFSTDLDERIQSWKTVHEVRGPKKDQVLTTNFSRG
ncbi:uncharacterized protein AB675_611 [Cyphellophora attinorum]|uniref:DUF6314 domain-containing protein n=1 Tax=Cyphellophora attinorum TaxID=1664694 RepID=A0A0N1P292_9EURO|nr:uncharacterized protein AB675_611 [Phialophora attinorum]KPI45483.1 hypothetical protein AB675_611 [Phialophora attinorum]